MANHREIAGAEANYDRPNINTIGIADLKDAVTAGLADFKAMPTHLIFLRRAHWQAVP